AHRGAVGLADDRHDRHVVELRVVQTVQQVDRTGPGRRHADGGPVAELGEADGLERRHLLVPGLDEPRLVVCAREGAEETVDAVARIAEDLFDPPLTKACQQAIGDGGGHGVPPRDGVVLWSCESSCNRSATSWARWTPSRPPLPRSWIWVRHEKPSARTTV